MHAHGRARWFATDGLVRYLPVFLLLAVLAYPTFRLLIPSWEQNPDYAHGWLGLPALAWLYCQRKPWIRATPSETWLGCLLILAGGGLHLGTLVVRLPLLDYLGWVLLLRGLALCYWGRGGANALLPVLGFAVILFPWPMVWLNQLAMVLQTIIAQLAEWILSCWWMCLRRGQLLYLAGMEAPVSVAFECSGVRQLLVFLVLAWFLALHLHRSWVIQVLYTLVSIPVAILANVLRVVLLVIMAKWWGTDSIEGVLHDVPLLLTLPVGVAILWWLFQRLQPAAYQDRLWAEYKCAETTKPMSAFPMGILLLIVLGQFALEHHLHEAHSPELACSIDLEQLPWQLGSWVGSPHPEAERIQRQADFADAALLRAYENRKGQAAAVYLVFSKTGRDRLHHPEICLRDAGGAQEWKAGRKRIPLDSHRQLERLCYQRQQNQRTTIYYWHYTILPVRPAAQTLLQRVHWLQNDQWPSLTVQVQTNTVDPTSWHALEQSFLPELDRWLLQQLPSHTQTGSERLPIRITLLR